MPFMKQTALQINKLKNTRWLKENFLIHVKYDDLSENELNAKSNKSIYVNNDVMTTVIKSCKGEKKKVKEK